MDSEKSLTAMHDFISSIDHFEDYLIGGRFSKRLMLVYRFIYLKFNAVTDRNMNEMSPLRST